MIVALPGWLTTWKGVWRRLLSRGPRAPERLLPRPAGRLALWLALIGLVLSLLATLVWLAGRYEASQVQAELERDTQDAVSDLRAGLTRDVQLLQGVQASMPGAHARREALLALLRDQREWLRIEQRDTQWRLRDAVDSPLREPIFNHTPRHQSLNETMRSCLSAKQFNGPAYSSSYYLPLGGGLGMEVMELCVPVIQERQLTCRSCWPSDWAMALPETTFCPSPKPMGRGWRSPAATGVASACSPPSSCWTCRATPWCCAWTGGAARPTFSPMC